ncbi:MAG: 4-hydroxybenzoate octaprenyltransferase [Acidiferrobacteraceae bacterium]|nr:4-hydroxybenzoate octaprenyltransferase [Acidiferrobacteraceae bacterium]|tara:strand:+ start:14882 stop:15757 length:876 start_codon:yes stop_codon:yes gene_type:complete
MLNKLSIYLRLMRINKPIGWLLLLWPTLWALWVAGDGAPSPKIVLIFIAGVFVMRAAGCIINDYFDKDLDRYVSRTKNRPLARGEITTLEAVILFIVLTILGLALVLTLNRLTVFLALGGFVLICVYPLLKRFTYLPQPFLGIVFSWGTLMAFTAQKNEVTLIASGLFLANLFWTIAYDTMYAMADRPDDMRVGIKSTAILVGQYDLIFNAACQVVALMILFFIGQELKLGIWFNAGLVGALSTVIYQNRLCKDRNPEKCLKAFTNNSWFGFAVFVGILISYLTAMQPLKI